MLLTVLYTVGPPVLISIWAFHEHDAWLLAGIAVSYVASLLAAWNSKLFFIFLCFCIGAWFRFGFSIHQYVTFFFFCALWGTLIFGMADEAWMLHRRSEA